MDWANFMLHVALIFFVLIGVVAAAPRAKVTADFILTAGLRRVGITDTMQQRVNKKRNMRRFMSHFGCTPEVAVALWNALQTTRNGRIHPRQMNLHWFLTTLHFLKTYKTEEELEAFTKETNLKLTREWVWWYIEKITNLKEEKVSNGGKK